MIKTKNLTFSYPKQKDALQFPDVALNEEESLLILGKSGVGKTTFLHLFAGLLKPKSGAVVLSDTAINKLSNEKLDVFRGKNIGLVFQKNYALQSLTVLENIQARLRFSKKEVGVGAILSLLEELGLKEHQKKYPKALSEGQLQRLGIAMSVIHQPKLILADEPTSSLDDENCKIVIELLQKQAKKTKANLIVITHDNRIKPFFPKSITL